ncbi:hypothetical protein CYMTET_7191 [Cymbomonas tetramitiformis]|uniref:Uncharacterized protein n=1 Tax=Cymbomonas tetramitiformis TaxID=36881 RepID=A0AAE0LHQ4_9CHLO|nr:hypothetical protein CYMTET_7191 [Cymbomonas tetramitiformis]
MGRMAHKSSTFFNISALTASAFPTAIEDWLYYVPTPWVEVEAQVTSKAEKIFGPKLMLVMQTGFVTVYALFFNFQKFNKAIAIGMVGLIGIFIQGKYVKAFIRVFLNLLRWTSRMVTNGIGQLRHVILGEKIVAKPVTEAERLLVDIHLVSPMEAHLQKVAYALLVGGWFIISWSLLTYSMLIREMMGSEAEAEMLTVWATTLAVEMFGVEALKLIAIRLFVEEVMRKIQELFNGVDEVQIWYEHHIMAIASSSTHEGEDNGEQDLGDDADADGGDGVFGGGDDVDMM